MHYKGLFKGILIYSFNIEFGPDSEMSYTALCIINRLLKIKIQLLLTVKLISYSSLFVHWHFQLSIWWWYGSFEISGWYEHILLSVESVALAAASTC